MTSDQPSDAPETVALPAVSTGKHRGRRVTSWLLIVVVGILTPVVLVAGWGRLVITDRDTYLAAVGPLATQPGVVAAIEDRTTDAVMAQVDKLDLDQQVTGWLEDNKIPPRVVDAASALLTSLNAGLRNLVSEAVSKVVESPQFAALWTRLNSVAHDQLVAILDGTSVLLNDEGAVALQLQPVLAAVRQQLVDNGRAWAAHIPDVDVQYVLLDAETTQQLQQIYRIATAAFWVLLVVAIVLAGAAVWLSPNHWHGLRRIALAVAFGAVILGTVLTVVQNRLTDAATDLRHPEAVGQILDSVLVRLRAAIRISAIVAVVVALAAWLVGSGRTSAAIRGWLSYHASGPRTGRGVIIGRAVAAALAIVAGFVLLFIDLTTGWTVAVVLLVVAALVLVVWAAREPGRATTAGGATAAA